MTWALWSVMNVLAAVAANVAEFCPAAIVTDAGTVRLEFVVEIPAAIPPVGAAWFNVTVQVVCPAGARAAELQAREEMPTGTATVTTPPVPVKAKASPEGVAPMGLAIPITVPVVTDGDRATLRTATTPSGIAVASEPANRQMYWLPLTTQESDLFAALAEGPALMLIEAMSDAENVSVHCSPAGLPPEVARVRPNAIVPPGVVVPLERAIEPDCARSVPALNNASAKTARRQDPVAEKLDWRVKVVS